MSSRGSTKIAGLARRHRRAVFAFVGAIFVFNILSGLFGHAPTTMLLRAFQGTWGTPYGIGQVLFKASPIMLTGLAFHVALRTGLFNIGIEGQLALASLGGALIASKLPAALPGPIAVTVTILSAAAVGAGLAAIAGALRAYRGVHEIISGIMLNRSVDVFLPWFLVVVLGAKALRTTDLPDAAKLSRLGDVVGAFKGSAASSAFPLAIAITFACSFWLKRSRIGRQMAWIGFNATACEAQGIPVARRQMQAMLLSGALAGCGIASTVMGYKGYFELGLGAGAGFTGIAVAMVGNSGPLSMVAASLVFGTLAQAGLAINAQLPKEAMGVLEAVVILLVGIAARQAGDDARAQPTGDDDEPTDAGLQEGPDPIAPVHQGASEVAT